MVTNISCYYSYNYLKYGPWVSDPASKLSVADPETIERLSQPKQKQPEPEVVKEKNTIPGEWLNDEIGVVTGRIWSVEV